MGAIAAGSLLPSAPPADRIIPVSQADLILHVILYAGLAVLLAWGWRAAAWRRSVGAAVTAFLFGLAIECIQPLTGRQFAFADLGANAAGSLLGAAIVLGACMLRGRGPECSGTNAGRAHIEGLDPEAGHR
jgi:VanZ family protein